VTENPTIRIHSKITGKRKSKALKGKENVRKMTIEVDTLETSFLSSRKVLLRKERLSTKKDG